MANLVQLSRRQVFSLEEAEALLPVVLRITRQYSAKVQQMIQRIDAVQDKNMDVATEIEDQVNDIVHEWQQKMEKLGIHPKGLWLADFDSGDGYYCWKFPEEKIEYWHRYSDGFSGRIKLTAPNVGHECGPHTGNAFSPSEDLRTEI